MLRKLFHWIKETVVFYLVHFCYFLGRLNISIKCGVKNFDMWSVLKVYRHFETAIKQTSNAIENDKNSIFIIISRPLAWELEAELRRKPWNHYYFNLVCWMHLGPFDYLTHRIDNRPFLKSFIGENSLFITFSPAKPHISRFG